MPPVRADEPRRGRLEAARIEVPRVATGQERRDGRVKRRTLRKKPSETRMDGALEIQMGRVREGERSNEQEGRRAKYTQV